jgi:hypothetical protein
MPRSRRERERRRIRYTDAKETAEKQQMGFTPTTVKLPKGIRLFYWKKDKRKYKLRVIPFWPDNSNPNADPEHLHWERSMNCHEGLGPDGRDRYPCLIDNKWRDEKRCPVHEYAKRLAKKGADDDYVDSVEKRKKRQLIAVIDQENKDKGIQIYEGPYYNGLGELIDNKINALDDDSKKRNFYHLKGGSILVVTVKSSSFSNEDRSGSFLKPIDLEIETGARDLPESVLDDVPCLDKLVNRLSYEELKEVVEQGEAGNGDDKEDDKSNRRRKSKGKSKISRGDTVNHPKYGKCEVTKISADGTTVTLEDGDEEVHTGIELEEIKKWEKARAKKRDEEEEEDEDDEEEEEEEEDDDEEEEEEEDEPKKKSKKGKKKSKKDEEDEDEEEEEDEDEDDDEDEEEEPKKKKGKKSKKDEEEDDDEDEEDEDDDEDEDEKEEEDEPKKKSKKKSKKDEDEDEDEEEEDEEPLKPSKKKGKKSKKDDDEDEDEDEDDWSDDDEDEEEEDDEPKKKKGKKSKK